jgi:3-phenylpropionate/trans-cinnamate dioxygenase ferredoxin reductase subunit
LRDPIVIVGGGPAAASAAHALRREGYQDGVVILGDEKTPPYERPVLSKAFLTSTMSGGTFDLLPVTWYADNDILLRMDARVAHLTLGSNEIRLTTGEPLRFSKLIVATGGTARHLPGAPLPGQLHHVRNVHDFTRLRYELGPGRHLLIVGAGFLGGEIASSARSLGTEVTMIEALEHPLVRVLGPMLGGLLAEIHREHGVRLLTGVAPVSFAREADQVLVTLSNGIQLECDAVVVAVGMTPNADLGRAAGLECNEGILVDQGCRTSSDDVFAAGDVAEHEHPLFGRLARVEHYENALKQGAVAAVRALGKPVIHADPHWFWSDQYDYTIQAVGSVGGTSDTVLRGDASERAFTLFYLQNGVVVGAAGMNSGHNVRRATRLISTRTPVPRAVLRDPSVDLRRIPEPA